ncbi:hypothetical protein M431DRAFT_507731 [Trichoderma harzianum CBS 226.95]|uniref:Uncharacterized protein n=1 Tax=Trichoderma harzianum CBS 226.95 TaxID=983964 RepID=A0A2T4AG60_TRIHA|nr:hypothetical protein M431DRAFT_507731 [Trichoderma harzianum CBS 226.95]PTB56069.1 hypothetical protein M431DRAFT_507731 [Trichoderma harzianum CBS 226.95]
MKQEETKSEKRNSIQNNLKTYSYQQSPPTPQITSIPPHASRIRQSLPNRPPTHHSQQNSVKWGSPSTHPHPIASSPSFTDSSPIGHHKNKLVLTHPSLPQTFGNPLPCPPK